MSKRQPTTLQWNSTPLVFLLPLTLLQLTTLYSQKDPAKTLCSTSS